ncbi:hypothetical protein ACHAQA_004873 [Verticillium albo-atrum]
MSVLQYSVAISLDVAKHARNLELAIFAGNLVQLQHVFRQFSKSPSEYPLGILVDAVATLEVFLDKVERPPETSRAEHETQVSNPTVLDDSILILDNDLTADFFSMARGMLRIETGVNESLKAVAKREECVEQVVAVAGRLAAVLVRYRIMRLSRCFKSSQHGKTGKHQLFEGLPSQLGRTQSRYLPLFLSTVHKQLDLTRKNTMPEFSAALKGAMQQMQKDLHEVAMSDVSQHASYVDFVRRAVSLIKSHASEICQIPAFFYQVSKEYSPPVQDPQLQVASINSYGIRLSEGDARAPPELFYYLYNNLKQALLHGKLGHEARILAKGMKEDSVLGFVLGKMLPVVLLTSVSKPEAFVLFDVYCEAVKLRMNSHSAIARQMEQSSCEQIPKLIQFMLRWIREIHGLNGGAVCAEHMHLFRKMVAILNLLQPTLTAASFASPLPAYWADVQQALQALAQATSSAEAGLASRLAAPHEGEPSAGLFQNSLASAGAEGREETLVASLARSTVTDFEKNWLVTAEAITTQAPARATQTGQGIERPRWDSEELGRSVLDELRIWNAWWARCRAHAQEEVNHESEYLLLL